MLFSGKLFINIAGIPFSCCQSVELLYLRCDISHLNYRFVVGGLRDLFILRMKVKRKSLLINILMKRCREHKRRRNGSSHKRFLKAFCLSEPSKKP